MPSRLRPRRVLASLLAAPLLALAALPAAADAAVTFSAQPQQSAGSLEIWRIAVGDFDGDRLPDVLAPLWNATTFDGGEVGLFAGKANGTVRRPQRTAFGPGVNGNYLATGDVDGDGDLDAVLPAAASSGEALLLRNDGDGAFTRTAIPASFGSMAVTPVIGDVNGDGKLDLVEDRDTGVAVLYGDGSGGFAAGPVTTVDTYAYVVALEAADFDGDGGTDLAVGDSDDRVHLLHGDGAGGFLSRGFVEDVSVWEMRTADLDGDGRSEVLVATAWTDDLTTIRLAQSGPAIVDRVSTGERKNSFAVGDVDGDRIADVVAVDMVWDGMVVLHGRGDGRFDPPVSFDLVPYGVVAPRGIGLADFDGDGRLDVAIGSQVSGVLTLLNTSRPAAAIGAPALDLGSQPRSTIGQAQTVTISNGGDAPLHVGTPRLSGQDAGDFLAGGCDGPVPAGASCLLPVRFLPSGAGARSATLTIPTDASGTPLTVALSGTGTELPAGPAGRDGADGGDGAPGTAGAPGPKGDVGAPGAKGDVGAKGDAGAAGPAGRDGAAAPLALVLAEPRLRATAARRSRVAFGVTAPGRATVTVRSGKRVLATGRATVRRAGASAVTLRGLPRGRYRLTLAFRAADGRTKTVVVSLDVRR